MLTREILSGLGSSLQQLNPVLDDYQGPKTINLRYVINSGIPTEGQEPGPKSLT